MSKRGKKQSFYKKSITTHWLVNSLGVVIFILILIELSLIAAIRNYYYSSAEQYLASQMNILSGAVTKYANSADVNYAAEIRSIVENYDEKDKAELMALDLDGSVTITSSGFSPEQALPPDDFTNAKQSADGTASGTYTLSTGEKVMARTVMLPSSGSEYAALRMMVSLEGIDSQVLIAAALLTGVVAAIILLMVFSGLYFIKSIVRPMRDIAAVSRRFATGDFSQRIEKISDDELGQLCDSINYMANELSDAEKVKNDFISSVSHELRTPLTAIKGWSETLTAIDDKETFQKGMRVITNEAERLSQMVEELLDFSRIQGGRLTLSMDTIDILAELGETVIMYQERARSLGITLNYYEPELLPFVMGDRNRLKQVFINIVDNAIKYSNAGGVVSAEAYEDGNDICIAISDTGMGISEEDLPKVKTKFFKANHTRRGSGIGLAVADEIIQRHGGTLTIDSRQGVGTTVMITLPFIKPANKTDKPDKQNKINVELITTEPERTETDER
ncbi:MAG: HAMP domain-containing sensor histidine kinase [Oscillospiraceae bacterium]